MIADAAREYVEGAEEADKATMLRAVLRARGPAAVFDVGRQIHTLRDRPVMQAILAARNPSGIVQRWIRLERFGHTTHRTEIVDSSSSWLALRHISTDGAAIDPIDDLFIWGLMVALVELGGFAVVRASVADDVELVLDGETVIGELPTETQTLHIEWASGPIGNTNDDAVEPGQMTRSLVDLFNTDLVESWRVGQAARRLGVSTRNLQRALRTEGTTFSNTLQRARVEAAHSLITAGRLSLTEVAFCTGFSDLAHFSRVFRQVSEIPPSALRDVLET